MEPASWWCGDLGQPVQPGLAWCGSRSVCGTADGAGATGLPPAYDTAGEYPTGSDPFGDIDVGHPASAGGTSLDVPPQSGLPSPGWGEPWGPVNGIYEAIMLGDNAFGHAISLPVELRDGGVLDFGREHALAWYSIWGWGVITDSSVVKIITN